jgi:hypothetical protein
MQKKYLTDQVKNSLKITLCVSITAFFAMQIFKLPSTIITWPIMASFFVPQMFRGDTRKNRIITQMIGATLSIIAITIASLLSINFYAYLIFMLILSFITFKLLKYGLNIFFPALVITIFALFAGGMPITENAIAIERGLWFLAGSLFAILITNTIWPYDQKKATNTAVKSLFDDIGNFLHTIINTALCGNFNRSRLFEIKYKIIQNLEETRALISTNKDLFLQSTFATQQRIFIFVVALSDLLCKPNSEYTVESIGKINNNLKAMADSIINMKKIIAIQQLPLESHSQKCSEWYGPIKEHLKQVSAIAEQQCNIPMKYDVKCLGFLLRKLYDHIRSF